MKKRIFLFLGILLILVAFLISFYTFFRVIMLFIGIGLIILSFTMNKNKKYIFLIILTISLFVGSYWIDYFLFSKFNHIPIYVYKIESSKKVKVYNSFFYRIYSCDKNLILDSNKTKPYVCGKNDLEEHDINAFIPEVISSFKDYNQKFIKLNGKISKISGVDTLELSTYKEAEDSLNGYVEFNTDYTVRIKVDNFDLASLRIYDNITVIGSVYNLEKVEETYIVTLADPLIIPSNIYNDYTFDVVESDSNELVSFVDKTNDYILGLSNIFVHFDQDNVYELSYLITDSRITVKDLIKDVEYSELKDDEETVKAKKYELEKFNILTCEKNDKVIFANKKSKLNIDMCEK